MIFSFFSGSAYEEFRENLFIPTKPEIFK